MGGRRLPPLSAPARARDDLDAILASAFAAVAAPALVRRLFQGDAPPIVTGQPYALVAAGKASAAMVERWYALAPELPTRAVAVGSHDGHRVPDEVEWFTGGHPTPTTASAAAADAALALARDVPRNGRLVVLLSGGASALLCRPVDGVSLADKQAITRALLRQGQPIDALNCVRKHLSQVKGGRLAAACPGETRTFAISDVAAPVEDDPSVIGSGPTVADPSTYGDAWRIVSGLPADLVPASVRSWLTRGVNGDVAESPKPGDAALARSQYEVIGSRRVAMAGAADEARRRGYEVVVIEPAVLGEARDRGRQHVQAVLALVAGRPGPLCVVSSGETTVTVVGQGRGGRNQEFVAGAIDALARSERPVVLASAGTDGIDGPTDAAGAWADHTTRDVARSQQVDIAGALDDNDAYDLHRRLGTLIRTGPTDTNVGDLQITLIY